MNSVGDGLCDNAAVTSGLPSGLNPGLLSNAGPNVNPMISPGTRRLITMNERRDTSMDKICSRRRHPVIQPGDRKEKSQ